MSLTVFAAMILSAFLHAAWNAWVKSRPDTGGALAALVIGAGVPNLGVILVTGLPDAPAWPWIAVAVALNLVALRLLAGAYREGDFAVAYPMIRGLIPLVLALAAVPFFGERLRIANLFGIVAISGGLGLLAWEASQRSRTMTLRGLGFAALAAGLTAGYVLTDAKAARISGDPFAYAATLAALNATVMAAMETSRGHAVLPMLRRHWPVATFGAVISMISYVLFIWSLMQAPVALVGALRETSVLFALLIATAALGERIGPWRWGAVATMFAGMMLIRL